ncbi:putative polysaccharide biosynthesis protein [Homoserinimonas aerilata]|uniref:Putative polysaccharide biosynthesis protein n=1 Tax=Homoserinimonas aerilata TaxID=1162970 RepID=A0A542YIJ3_9MICO|nr:sugar-transfer associated ATP-grasp domain-containing protein [Homoserinimonas aerilata]TQL47915.1 putative polysaccharide biosynthesis protein [Homoserinimonas aerilata]
MSKKSLDLGARLKYFVDRVRGFNGSALWSRARAVAAQHGKNPVAIVVDMLWSAAFRSAPFQDYVDWDFAILNRTERATYMTHAISNHLAMTFDEPAYRGLFHDKIEFNKTFDGFLGREWLDVREASAEELQDFVERHGVVMGKVPFSDSGHGVERYEAAATSDWAAFRSELLTKGQTLVEEYITQHPVLAAVCPGTANTTRVTTFFDGSTTHVLSMAQKFGRGQASDQQTFGGFYTMLDLDGASRGPGYDSHDGVHPTHPESGVSIPDFRLPMIDELFAFMQEIGRVVPQMRYVGWDVVIGEKGPVLVEGNWAAGVYENKPSITGIRTGSLPRYREVIGF